MCECTTKKPATIGVPLSNEEYSQFLRIKRHLGVRSNTEALRHIIANYPLEEKEKREVAAE